VSTAAREPRRGTLPKAVVGIDLGTTHTALAWARCQAGAEPIQMPIPQWVAGRRRAELALLPSVVYAPAGGELPEASSGPERWVAGEYARIRTQETVGRGVASAKSWLCHTGVERLESILPWGTGVEGVDKLSPVEVSQRLLEHVRTAFVEQHPELGLEDVLVVLTVPASFDPTARKLTVLAAERSGLRVRLLEEPQAAFYEYLGQNEGELFHLVARAGPLVVLVCDIGGGTLDLSLIEVEPQAAGLGLRRSAVGRHLLLGGDNMDLALARSVEASLGAGALDAERFGQLLLSAQRAKEVLLGPDPPESFPIRVLGAGSQLLGKALAADVSKRQVEALVLDGFFPHSALGELPEVKRVGLTTFGLPYERDPRVTRHIAQFLARHTDRVVPGALLLNGGVTRSPRITERIVSCLSDWAGRDIECLTIPDPLLSVSRGAVRYGLALCGFGARIEGGSAFGYYVGVGAPNPDSGPQALCVVPRGAKEGERHVVGMRRFELTVGRPARFELYASDTALHAPGTRVDLDPSYQALPPVTTRLVLPGGEGETRVRVQLEGELSAIGTLELGCTVLAEAGEGSEPPPSMGPAPRLSLAFELGSRQLPPGSVSGRAQTPAPPRLGFDRSRLAAAETAVDRVFGKGRKDVAAREVKDLLRTWERVLGPKKTWDLEQNRTLCDVLLSGYKARTRSEDHERVFWMLTGQCLRPGFGHALDPERVAVVCAQFDAGLSFRDAERNWQQYWIAWQRVAGGLDEAMQGRIRALGDPVLAPPELKLKKPKGFRPGALGDLLSLASHLERVEPGRRVTLGGWILDRTWSDRDPRLWTYLGRIGARVPSYASAHYALPNSVVERWVEQLLRERWSEVPTAAQAAVSLARVTGDQTRDLNPKLRQDVARALERAGVAEELRRAVLELVPITRAQREQQLGDDLPLGLRLLD
jgi:molecular chaperone DnaK (HSP70)